METTKILWLVIAALVVVILVLVANIVEKKFLIKNLRDLATYRLNQWHSLTENFRTLEQNYEELIRKYDDLLIRAKDIEAESKKNALKIKSLKDFCNKLHHEKLDLIKQAKCKRFNPKEATTTTEIRDYIIGLYENGCSYREIADITGFKKNTINKAILKWKNQGLVGPVRVNNYDNLDK